MSTADVYSLSTAQCILLAADLASDSNIDAFQAVTSSRHNIFNFELICRILLTFLPESVDPTIYVTYIDDASRNKNHKVLDEIHVDCSSVQHLSDGQARKRLKKLHLLPLRHSSVLDGVVYDTLTLFVIHRAHRIDVETGLLPLVPKLVRPFVERDEYLRDWYTAAVLPLFRLYYEYYEDDTEPPSLEAFETLEGPPGLNALLSRTEQSIGQSQGTNETVGRDLRGVVAPWVYGKQAIDINLRKRKRRKTGNAYEHNEPTEFDEQNIHVHGILGGTEEGGVGNWVHLNNWIVAAAVNNYPLAVRTIVGWNGPSDVDFGDERLSRLYLSEVDKSVELHTQYCQAALAVPYAADQDTSEVVDGAYSILVRLASLLGYDPPPDLSTSVHSLPNIGNHTHQLQDTLMKDLQIDELFRPHNPLTAPNVDTFSLLQMLVYSAHLLRTLGHNLSIAKIAKLRFCSDEDDQLRSIQMILRGCVDGPRKEESQWSYVRDIFRWLWDWSNTSRPEPTGHGYGVFGKVKDSVLEKEILRTLCVSEQFSLVERIYLESGDSQNPLDRNDVEDVILNLAFQYYDNATNGNRTRGRMKKCSDLIGAFRRYFSTSTRFSRGISLVTATHALSFYTLVLHQGKPFLPVSIRASEDPVSLIGYVLEQNPKSYTELDNLIEIAINFIKAGLPKSVMRGTNGDAPQPTKLLNAERRVTSMAIEAALRAEDFETAYSYVVNRLSPPELSPSPSTSRNVTSADDDISWRAALHAGRHRSTAGSLFRRSGAGATSPQIRHLEQRMELLARALILAPSPDLSEVLNAWRRCEEELLSAVAQESAAEEAFDNKADRGEATGVVPGAFGETQSEYSVQPRRKEFGRGPGEEAPMGLFDVARGAAAALQRSASGTVRAHDKESHNKSFSEMPSDPMDSLGRRRKRDVVANAVTGGLVSGIGWVLGARPVHEQDGSAQ